MEHLLYPRFSAFTTICQYLREQRIYLYDFTLVYWETVGEEKNFKNPTLIDLFWPSKDQTWHVEITV